MYNATKSLNKLKTAREECSNWSLADQKLSSTARGTSKVFPSRVTTADPQTFRTPGMKPQVTSGLRNSLNVEATRLNSSAKAWYAKTAADGSAVSKQVQQSLKPNKNSLLKIRQSRYVHPPEAKNTIVESPEVFVPRRASMMNA